MSYFDSEEIQKFNLFLVILQECVQNKLLLSRLLESTEALPA